MIFVLLLVVLLPSSFASHFNDDLASYGYELVCPENELLQDTMPCCEPTCDNDCSNVRCAEVYVRQPTCVCKPGYVRHQGKCIPKCNCPLRPSSPPTCGENEELLPSPPCCEPTCTDDCSDCDCRTRYVDQPTCVCKKGFRRHNGKCIRVDQCPSCGPYATLAPCAPCCEPTCENDCSNVLCIAACQGDPVCVCQQGYVKNNGTCLKRELCPRKTHVTKQYCRCRGKKRPASAVQMVYHYPDAPTAAPPTPQGVCNYCNLPEPTPPPVYRQPPVTVAPPPPPTYVPVPYPPVTYGPPVTYAPPPTCAPPPPVYQTPPPPVYQTPPPPVYHTPPPYVPPTAAPCSCNYQTQPTPCPYAPTTPKPYYQQPPSSLRDQPYYAIPALQQCACATGVPAASSSCAGGLGQPVRQYNVPPISYRVNTPFPCTAATAAPPSAPCPCAQPLPVVYNLTAPVPYQPGPCPYAQQQAYADQPYLPQPPTTVAPPPVDVTYIALPDGTTTQAPTMMCFGAL
ncbi:hypothetical protein ZHAS_00019507 [Anopheles sinensis]|uniref:EGF-like domain-containing protein n=1 Tax=Anopheles sinensis TaxID=74873 RepID=A0A084WML2_ANOSI|nr:hypothetical protein ZHAS_00019507 [Anopheles sinensis]